MRRCEMREIEAIRKDDVGMRAHVLARECPLMPCVDVRQREWPPVPEPYPQESPPLFGVIRVRDARSVTPRDQVPSLLHAIGIGERRGRVILSEAKDLVSGMLRSAQHDELHSGNPSTSFA